MYYELTVNEALRDRVPPSIVPADVQTICISADLWVARRQAAHTWAQVVKQALKDGALKLAGPLDGDMPDGPQVVTTARKKGGGFTRLPESTVTSYVTAVPVAEAPKPAPAKKVAGKGKGK